MPRNLCVISAIFFAINLGCEKIQITSEPGQTCSEKVHCDTDLGLVCLAATSKCACDAMFTWNEATKECTESSVGGAVRTNAAKCQEGDFMSCYELGMLYRRGKVVAEDEVGAAQLLRQACDGKFEKACTALLVSRDGEACSFSFACNKNIGLECDETSNRCRCKTNTQWNDKKSGCEETELGKTLRDYRRKCKAGELTGCHELAKMYASGQGVKKNPGKAITLFEQGCTAKYQPSCDICIMMSGCQDLVGSPGAQ